MKYLPNQKSLIELIPDMTEIRYRHDISPTFKMIHVILSARKFKN
jgi:hypothetical protein